MIDGKDIFIGCTYRHNENWCGKRTDDLDIKEFNFKYTPSDWYLVGECLLFLDDISGIPLTPGILEACGFVIERNYDYDLIFKKGFFELEYMEFAMEEHNGYYYNNNTPKEIRVRYLHQLQNLYYSLLDEEIIYNPK